MAWFKVDDGLHDHRKTRKLRRSHPTKRRDVAPFGLWVLAGSWAGGNGTKGFVPTEVVEEWDDDATALAERLVSAGLWWETKQDDEPGYGFHDWQDYMPRIDGLEDASESGRRGNHVRWHEQRQQSDPDCEFCAGNRGDIGAIDRGDGKSDIGSHREPVPTRPDPTPICASTDVERGFEEWWSTYPRKRGKGQAMKAYRGALKKVGGDTLLASLRQQLPTLTAKGAEYTPYPSTWLNGERWEDQPDIDQPSKTGSLPSVHEIPQPPDGLTDAEYRTWWQQNQVRK